MYSRREADPEKWAQRDKLRLERRAVIVSAALERERKRRLHAGRLARAVQALDDKAYLHGRFATSSLTEEEEKILESVMSRPEPEDTSSGQAAATNDSLVAALGNPFDLNAPGAVQPCIPVNLLPVPPPSRGTSVYSSAQRASMACSDLELSRQISVARGECSEQSEWLRTTPAEQTAACPRLDAEQSDAASSYSNTAGLHWCTTAISSHGSHCSVHLAGDTDEAATVSAASTRVVTSMAELDAMLEQFAVGRHAASTASLAVPSPETAAAAAAHSLIKQASSVSSSSSCVSMDSIRSGRSGSSGRAVSASAPTSLAPIIEESGAVSIAAHADQPTSARKGSAPPIASAGSRSSHQGQQQAQEQQPVHEDYLREQRLARELADR
jgi:hypothetical protein